MHGLRIENCYVREISARDAASLAQVERGGGFACDFMDSFFNGEPSAFTNHLAQQQWETLHINGDGNGHGCIPRL